MKTLPKSTCLNLSASKSPHRYNCSHPRAKFKRVPTLGQDRDCSGNPSTSPVPYLSRWIKQDHIKKQAFYQTHHPKSYKRKADLHLTTRKSRKVSEPPVSEMPFPAPAQPTVTAEPENHQPPTPTTSTPPLQPHQAPQQSKIPRPVRRHHLSPNLTQQIIPSLSSQPQQAPQQSKIPRALKTLAGFNKPGLKE